jgi:hypothetical protein
MLCSFKEYGIDPPRAKGASQGASIDRANRIALADPIIEAFRKQCRLLAIRPLNETLHHSPRRFSKRIIASMGFSHSLGQEQTSRRSIRSSTKQDAAQVASPAAQITWDYGSCAPARWKVQAPGECGLAAAGIAEHRHPLGMINRRSRRTSNRSRRFSVTRFHVVAQAPHDRDRLADIRPAERDAYGRCDRKKPGVELAVARVTLGRQPHKFRAPVLRIVDEFHEPLGYKLICQPLHALTAGQAWSPTTYKVRSTPRTI